MSMIDDWKGKAAGYLDDVSKKKDELIEKAATLRREHAENQRIKMEDWVYKKERELNSKERELNSKEAGLKELEKTLKKREELLGENEQKFKQRIFVRFIGVVAGLAAIGLFAFGNYPATTEIGKHSLTTEVGKTEATLPPPKSSEPYTPRESAVYSTYGNIDATNPRFDVGKYCLEKEKNGSLTFEECLGVAASKISPRK